MKTYSDPIDDAIAVLADLEPFKISRYVGKFKTDIRPCKHRGEIIHDPETKTFSCGECGAHYDNYAVALRMTEALDKIKYRVEGITSVYQRDLDEKYLIRASARQKRCKHTLKRKLHASGYWFCPSCELTFGDSDDPH